MQRKQLHYGEKIHRRKTFPTESIEDIFFSVWKYCKSLLKIIGLTITQSKVSEKSITLQIVRGFENNDYIRDPRFTVAAILKAYIISLIVGVTFRG